MSALIISDTHFTENPRDSYRWGLFDWLKQKVKELNITEVIHAGDACDSKDRHPASLVNRFCDELVELSKLCNVFLLIGNHDYIDPNTPFFLFTQHLNIEFIKTPSLYTLSIGECLFLPSTKNWKEEWKSIDFNSCEYIFTHATFDGCKIENGTTLTGGIPPNIFKDFRGSVFSGDIHVPQKLSKNIEYIGSPYRVHFGDAFSPRVLLIKDDGDTNNLSFNCINKHSISMVSMVDLSSAVKSVKIGDQIKVKVLLKRADLPNWKLLKEEIKVFCQEKGFVLFGPELVLTTDSKRINSEQIKENHYFAPKDIIADFCKKNRLSKESQEIGLSIIEQLQ
jgi:DNA repair exonuclease SbcCD nuclease subunit